MSCSCLQHFLLAGNLGVINSAAAQPTPPGNFVLHAIGQNSGNETSSRRKKIPTKAQQNWLIRGGFLYTANPLQPYIANSWVQVVDDRIAAIGEIGNDEPECDRILNAHGKLVLPGFVNPHWHESLAAPNDERPDDSHLALTPYAQGGNIEALGAVFGFISAIGKRMTADEAVAIARWSLWTQLRSGTTALGDVGSANTADGMAQAALDLGMRIRVSRWGSDIMLPKGLSTFKKIADTQEQIDDWEALMDRWNHHASGLIGGMPSVMGAFGSSDEQLIAMREIAARYQSPYATHLAPLRNEAAAVKAVFGHTAIERFDALGLLTNRLIAVHTNHATEAEYQRLLETGVHICHSPAHYGMLGESSTSETRQIARFLRDGAPVSCSTDGGITYIGGMAEAMRAAHLGHNEATNDNTTCPPTTALLTATRNGANALGWGDTIGSIEPGKQADLVLVDIDDWRYRIGNHPLRTFLIAGGSKDVDTVMVAGDVVVRKGRSTRFDETELFEDYQRAAQSVRARIRP
jgi:cytosine/adenosine deaminase-related metal-dependent hydrolase